MKKKKTNTENIRNEINKKILIIKDFASKMGYTVTIEEYPYHGFHGFLKEGEKCISIELNETSDSEGNCFCWAWSLKSGREII